MSWHIHDLYLAPAPTMLEIREILQKIQKAVPAREGCSRRQQEQQLSGAERLLRLIVGHLEAPSTVSL
jgi:hypothetical protein